MKSLKKLKQETNEILNKIKDTHYDEFTQVNEYQKEIKKYYAANTEKSNNYNNETLLQMYKYISKENKLIYNNMNALIGGVVGGFVVELIEEFDTLPAGLLSGGFIAIALVIVALIIIKFVLKSTYQDPSIKDCFFDKVHSNILESILKERGFCIFKGDKS